ncbi:unnamed protein product [Fraxinus pennsylvanica]|uniref:Uncharacterized protein n=1 Tax=Fraxinus pennsylvanica TaxID=56036 RepID=A0AAD2DN22_9LAMI|nr:unnamed protein product [Fraxinus pennsylvanica]
MGGLEGIINILDSEGGFGSLEMQSIKIPESGIWVSIPGYESYPENDNSIKMLEAAMQRLTNLCSIVNDMEPICVLNHVFVLREVNDCHLSASLMEYRHGD